MIDDVLPANEGIKPLDASRVVTDQGIVYRQRVEFAGFGPKGTHQDAFGRLRTSSSPVVSLFNSQSEYGNSTIFWETLTANGGAVANDLTNSTVNLSVTTTANSRAVRQTRIFWRYVPGKSNFVKMTYCAAAPATNLIQRIGQFSKNNGLFISYEGSDVYLCVRNGGTDVKVARADWDDPLDGTGPSGLNYGDLTGVAYLFGFDYEWLGVGSYRFMFADKRDGKMIKVFEQSGINRGLAVPYTHTMNLPLRYEILGSGAAGAASTLRTICAEISSEGGDVRGSTLSYSADTAATAKAINNGTTGGALVPIVSIRAKTTGPNSVVNRAHTYPTDIEIAPASGTNNTRWVLLLNTTLTGATWAAPTGGQITEADVAATALSGGTVIDSGYVASTGAVRSAAASDLLRDLPLVYTELGSVQDTLTLAAYMVGGTGSALGVISYTEVL